jgi:hypothetical protein
VNAQSIPQTTGHQAFTTRPSRHTLVQMPIGRAGALRWCREMTCETPQQCDKCEAPRCQAETHACARRSDRRSSPAPPDCRPLSDPPTRIRGETTHQTPLGLPSPPSPASRVRSRHKRGQLPLLAFGRRPQGLLPEHAILKVNIRRPPPSTWADPMVM